MKTCAALVWRVTARACAGNDYGVVYERRAGICRCGGTGVCADLVNASMCSATTCLRRKETRESGVDGASKSGRLASAIRAKPTAPSSRPSPFCPVDGRGAAEPTKRPSAIPNGRSLRRRRRRQRRGPSHTTNNIKPIITHSTQRRPTDRSTDMPAGADRHPTER